MKNLLIQPATLKEMEFLLSLANAEGWNPGIADSSPFYYTDPNGFFVGKIDGNLVGCISAVAYNSSYGFLGFYIILPKFRGKGFGRQLWEQALAYLGKRTIGLDGVVAEQENYKKSGFQLYYNNIRCEGKVKGDPNHLLVPINEIPFDTLLNYDKPIFGANRSQFLKLWLKMPNIFGYAKKVEDQIIGYGCMRQCKMGYKIGPLYADELTTANEIFLALSAKSHDASIFLDVPAINETAMQLASEYKLHPVFKTARMYRGIPPDQNLQKVFGVTSFELG